MFTTQPLCFQYAPQRKSKAEANCCSKWVMEMLEDRTEPVALGLRQVLGSTLIFKHRDCKMSGCFRWVLWCVHCLLSQVTREHHPNKTVCAQDQWPRPDSDLCAETVLERFNTTTQTDATGHTQSLAENTSPCDGMYWGKAELDNLCKFSPLLCNCLFLTQSLGQLQQDTAGGIPDLRSATSQRAVSGVNSMLLALACSLSSPSPSLLHLFSLFATQMLAHSCIAYKPPRPGWPCSCLSGSWNASKSSVVFLYQLSRTMYLFMLYLWSLQSHHIPYSTHYSSQIENSAKQKEIKESLIQLY